MIPEWMDQALCRHFASLPWISEPEERCPAAETAMAVVCSVCPVLSACQEYAERRKITAGFWAGLERSLPAEGIEQDGAA